ncbi:hypothetical protein Bbelb_047030 [Branchiostoma belcheri]|nr:hypothetical protein Bbelb_047030 [Branchiostoma belcheri]
MGCDVRRGSGRAPPSSAGQGENRPRVTHEMRGSDFRSEGSGVTRYAIVRHDRRRELFRGGKVLLPRDIAGKRRYPRIKKTISSRHNSRRSTKNMNTAASEVCEGGYPGRTTPIFSRVPYLLPLEPVRGYVGMSLAREAYHTPNCSTSLACYLPACPRAAFARDNADFAPKGGNMEQTADAENFKAAGGFVVL